MPVVHFSSSFNAGLLSPHLDARTNVEKYDSGCAELDNFIPLTHGPITRRPGTQFVELAASATVAPRLIGFEFATGPVLAEMGHGAWRFFKNGALIAGVSVVHPYADAELFEVQVVQVNDVIFLTHYAHVPMVLSHFSDTNWTLREVHEPATGWGAGATFLPPVPGNAVLLRWHVAAFQFASLEAAAAYANVTPPTATVASAESPGGTGNSFPPAIQRVRAFFVAPANGSYVFRAEGIDDAGWIRFESAHSGTGSGAVQIVAAVGGASANSAAFTLVAGKGYWTEFLLYDTQPPSAGSFKFSKDGGAFQKILASHLSATAFGPVNGGGSLIGWPAMLDENVTNVRLAASAIDGAGNVTLTADSLVGVVSSPANIFTASHVGAWYQIAHRRETAFSELVGAVGAFASSSTAVRIIGRYEITTYGIWSGTVHLERQASDGTWQVERTWIGKKDRNVSTTGTADEESAFRLRIVGGDGVAASTAAVPRFIIEAADAKVYGLVKVVGFTSASVVTAKVFSTILNTTETPMWTEGAWSQVQGYPRTMTLHEQSTIYGGTDRQPQALWSSVKGDFENFRRGSFDDAGWMRVLASESSHTIQWLVSQDTLVIGTSRGYWVGESPSGGVLTPTAGTFTRRSGAGSSYHPAILANESIIFIQSTGLSVRRLSFRDDVRRYGSTDLTVLADQVTASGVRQMVWQQQKKSILWAVASDGRLIGMTMEEEQNVFAWHQHKTNGQFLSVAVISGVFSDEVWVAVRRGAVICIERFDIPTYIGETPTPLYADSGRAFKFAVAATELTGLAHLAGRDVRVLTEAGEATHAVSNLGTVTLGTAVLWAIAGLSFESRFRKMKAEVQMQDGSAQGRKVKVARVTLRHIASAGGTVSNAPGSEQEAITYSPEFGETKFLGITIGEVENLTLSLFSGDTHSHISSTHDASTSVTVRTSELKPMTVAAIILKLDVYGD
jgi:hypothetical protein